MQEQVELKFYVKGRLFPMTKLVFDDLVDCKNFLEELETKDFIICHDVAIKKDLIKYVRIKQL